jgi:hypothetical protein
VGRIGQLALIVLALASQPASGASRERWTAQGIVTALGSRTITVHGATCRITTASPSSATLRLYYVGAEAKIACTKGVLRSISPVKGPTSIAIKSHDVSSGGGSSFTWVAPVCGPAPKGQDTYVGSPSTVTCASGTVSVFGPSSAGDPCAEAFVAGTPAGYSDRLCASVTVGSLTCGIKAFFYVGMGAQYVTVGQPATIGCIDGVLQVIHPGTT